VKLLVALYTQHVIIYLHTKFHKDWFSHFEVDRGDTQITRGSNKPFFFNKERRIQIFQLELSELNGIIMPRKQVYSEPLLRKIICKFVT
jgi:hypothetical protein